MALAARLSLRMQKELKLLLNDPPPGVSVLPPSDDEGLSCASLSVINASVEGPDGTAYANGVFHIRIQIPERYPFLPPNVTFVTPIYHPNIDNGGRICLDILNMPPKGAWLPSLNISTVLTSISLLLSDPNPDDGLMCEISREYKYNRQIFEQKARSWTERFAKSDLYDRSNDACTMGTSEGLVAEQEDRNLEYHDVDGQRNGNKVHKATEKRSLGCTTATEKCGFDCKEYASRVPKSEALLVGAQTGYSNKENDVSHCRLSLSLSGNSRVQKIASPGDRSDCKENVEPMQFASPFLSYASVNWNSNITSSKENNRLSLNPLRKNVKAKKALADSRNYLVNGASPCKLPYHTTNVTAAVPSECRVPDDNSSVNHAVTPLNLKNLAGSSKNLMLKRAANSTHHLPGHNRITEASNTNNKESDEELDKWSNILKTSEVVIVSDSEESDDEDNMPSGKRMCISRKRVSGLSTSKKPHV